MMAAHARLMFATAALASLVLFASIPGYFSHDELEWLGRASGSVLTWSEWIDLSPLQWRPLTFDLWLALDQLIGDRPWLQHAVFALAGIANAWLLIRLLRKLGVSDAASLGAGAAFLWLPSVVYTHGWVATLADVICLGLLLGIALRLASRPGSAFVDAIVVVAMTLAALASKESAVVFPALLLGLAAAGVERRRILLAIALSGFCVAIYLALRWHALFGAPNSEPIYATNLGAVPMRWLEYFLFPFVPPLLECGVALQKSLARLVLAGALHTGVCLALARIDWRWPVAYLALFTAALGPVLVLGASANHYAYLASAAVCTVVAVAWPRFDCFARGLVGAALTVALVHGIAIGLKLREIGAMQTRFFVSLAAIQNKQPGVPLRIGAQQSSDVWLLQRWLLAGKSFRGVAIADRLVPSGSADADLLMHPDGSVEWRRSRPGSGGVAGPTAPIGSGASPLTGLAAVRTPAPELPPAS